MTTTVCATMFAPAMGDTDPVGLDLVSHLLACHRARSRAFGLHCFAERLHDLTAPRFFTTMCAAAGLMALLSGCA